MIFEYLFAFLNAFFIYKLFCNPSSYFGKFAELFRRKLSVFLSLIMTRRGLASFLEFFEIYMSNLEINDLAGYYSIFKVDWQHFENNFFIF